MAGAFFVFLFFCFLWFFVFSLCVVPIAFQPACCLGRRAFNESRFPRVSLSFPLHTFNKHSQKLFNTEYPSCLCSCGQSVIHSPRPCRTHISILGSILLQYSLFNAFQEAARERMCGYFITNELLLDYTFACVDLAQGLIRNQ